MAASQAIRAAVKVVSTLLTSSGKNKNKGSGSAIKVLGALLLSLPILAVYIVIASPLGAWALFTGDNSSKDFDTGELMAYGLYDFDVDGTRVSWYMDEANNLENWAKNKWNSGRGDIYNTPDWRYLYAFDMALAENDFSLVSENEDYYKELHHNLVSATSVSHTYRVTCDQTLARAQYDEETDTYYIVEHYVTWTVNTKSFESSFRKNVFTGEISEDFLYFVNNESGDWGADGGWGDQGNALGGLQFDRRFGLDDFLAYAINSCPGEYDYLSSWAAMTTIPQADDELLAQWRRAYAQDPDKWIQLQISFEYESYYAPGEEALLNLGFDCSTRPDAIKGLVASLCNLNGVGGATRYFEIANLSDSMSDEEVARALAGAIIDNPPQPYPTAYANRYSSELETVLSLLESGSSSSNGTPATYLGDNPDAEGKNLDVEQKGEIAQNYRRSLYAVDVYYDEYGILVAEIDKDKYTRIVSLGEEIKSLDTATTEEGKRIVEACSTVDSPGFGYCAMWVSQVYNAAGCGYPTGNANDMWRNYCSSSDYDDLMAGMIIAVQHSSGSGDGWTYGHVGIYVGEIDGTPTVMDNIGYVRTISLDAWIAENNYSGDVAWGWAL